MRPISRKPLPRPQSVVPRSIGTRGMSQYAMGLRDPFQQSVNGVRLPNEFATPTVTAVLRGYSTLGGTNSKFNTGFLFMPNPYLSLIDKSKAGVFSSDCLPYSLNTQCRYSCSFANMITRFSSWRVVCGGIRIRNISGTVNTAAIISVAPLVVSGPGPGPNNLNNNTLASASQLVFDLTGMNYSGPDSFGNSITTLPGFNRCTTQDLIDTALVIPFRPRDSRAYDFRVSQDGGADSLIAGQTSGNSITFNSTTGASVLNSIDSTEAYTCEGWSAIALDISQTVLNPIPVIEVEYVYHIEGIPQSSISSGGLCDSATQATSGSYASHLTDLIKANSEPLMRIATSAVGTLFKSAVDSRLLLGTQY